MESIEEGSNSKYIREHHPSIFLRHKRSIESTISEVQREKQKEDLIEEDEFNCNNLNVKAWHLVNIGKTRIQRQKHLYLWGKTKFGKSSYKIYLKRYYMLYEGSIMGKFWDGMDEYQQIIFFDDVEKDFLKKEHKLSILKNVLSGEGISLETKGGSFFYNKNLPCIITSNHSFEELFKVKKKIKGIKNKNKNKK